MNITENSAAIKNEQSTGLNLKRTGCLNHQIPIPLQRKENPSSISPQTTPFDFIDFYEIKGQYEARRVMEIAAAGFHHTLLIGPPGSGKTMFIKALPSILPGDPPLRFPSPHTWNNNEINLALHGILIMDEFLQFKTAVIESLRLPMDDYTFMLIFALNPPDKTNERELQRFHEKITPPFLDRIELIAKTRPVEIEDILDKPYLRPEKSKTIKARVTAAREILKVSSSLNLLKNNCALSIDIMHLLYLSNFAVNVGK